ncbi:hypothetical protein AAH979_29930 [Plantactinospora sp. ZYX-F-223]|uniref:hypothetical protein n=1 Tax=Plantactinospora sp. ZYX-F-223 TaxID=3144103 RepID=UPI0031FDEC58
MAYRYRAVAGTQLFDDRALGRRPAAHCPLVGFAWGYRQDSHGELHLSPLRLLGPADWNGHRPYLAERYPTWTFDDGSPLARHPGTPRTGGEKIIADGGT